MNSASLHGGNAPLRTDRCGWSRAGLVLLLSQLLFWTFLYVIERNTQPQNFQLPQSLPLFLSDASGKFDLNAEPILVPYNNEPAYLYRDTTGAPKGLFRISFTNAASSGELSFYIGWDGQFVDLVLNNVSLPIGGRKFEQTNMSGFAPGIYQLPADFLQSGRNTLDVVVEPRNNKFISHYAIGASEALMLNYRWGQGVAYALPVAGFGAAIFLMVLCLVIPWEKEDRIRVVAFCVLLMASILRNMQFFGLELPLAGPWAHVAHFAAVFMLLFAFVAVASAWTGAAWRTLSFIGGGYLASLLLVVAGMPLFSEFGPVLGMSNFFYWGWMLETVFTVALAVFVFGRLLQHSAHAPALRQFEYVVILFCMTAVLIEHLDHRFRLDFPFVADLPIKNYFTSIVGVVLPLGLCAAVVNESVRARRMLKNLNRSLAIKLAEKEVDIRQQTQDKTIIDERRRLMRDMHDDLGAILSGLLVRTRTRDIPYEEVPGEIQEVLDELRLIVDSLDSAGDTLAVSIGAFRARSEGRLRAAGIDLDWDVDPESANYACPASHVLQIYRIMQEATANAIRHSGADRISIALRRDLQSGLVRLELADNGSGFDTQPCDRKGIRNMHERARQINARLTVTSCVTGTTTCLELPPSGGHETRQTSH